MNTCGARHPVEQELTCVSSGSGRTHPAHTALRHVPGQSRPEFVVWDSVDYTSPEAKASQLTEARQTVERAKKAIDELPRLPRTVPPGQVGATFHRNRIITKELP